MSFFPQMSCYTMGVSPREARVQQVKWHMLYDPKKEEVWSF